MANRFFYYGLAASFLIHLFIITFFSLPATTVKLLKKPSKQIEVTYRAVKKGKDPGEKSSFKKVQIVKPSRKPQDVKVASRGPDAFPTAADNIKDISKITGKLSPGRKMSPRIDIPDLGRKITIPMLTAEKITNPKYLSYNQNIRRRIQQRAYAYVNQPDFQAGEVYLTFVLASTGELRQVKVIREKTSASVYLQRAGRGSIEESAPFPPFPHDLSYPELTFNVIISFEVDEQY